MALHPMDTCLQHLKQSLAAAGLCAVLFVLATEASADEWSGRFLGQIAVMEDRAQIQPQYGETSEVRQLGASASQQWIYVPVEGSDLTGVRSGSDLSSSFGLGSPFSVISGDPQALGVDLPLLRSARGAAQFGLGVNFSLAPNLDLQGMVFAGQSENGLPSLDAENRQLALIAAFRF